MKTRIVKKSSIFPASKKKIFNLLKEFDLLREIAFPYLSFIPVSNPKNLIWEEGKSFVFKAKLLGFIPFGTHRINVIEFNEEKRIYTNEQHSIVPIWNHEITLKEISENQTEYADIVEIYAGLITYFIYLWANLFYAHRQRKWIKILKRENDRNK